MSTHKLCFGAKIEKKHTHIQKKKKKGYSSGYRQIIFWCKIAKAKIIPVDTHKHDLVH